MANAVLLAVLTAHVAFLCHSFHAAAEPLPEKALIAELLRVTPPLGRPVRNASDTVSVELGMNLFRVMEVYPDERKLVVFAGLFHRWVDNGLQWDPAANDDVTSINLPVADIWTPYVEHIDALETPVSMLIRPTDVKVYHHGEVYWEPIYKFVTKCRKYERGTLTCTLVLGLFTEPDARVELTPSSKYIGTDLYEANAEWELHSSKVDTVQFFYESVPEEKYTNVIFEIKLRNRSWHAKKKDTVDNGASRQNTMDLFVSVFIATLLLSYSQYGHMYK